jgi:hypothetical protein
MAQTPPPMPTNCREIGPGLPAGVAATMEFTKQSQFRGNPAVSADYGERRDRNRILRRRRQPVFRLFYQAEQSGTTRKWSERSPLQKVPGRGKDRDPQAIPVACGQEPLGSAISGQLARNLGRQNSYFVGDKAIDVECGHRAGTRTVLVLTGYGKEQQQDCEPDFIAKDAVEGAHLILGTVPPNPERFGGIPGFSHDSRPDPVQKPGHGSMNCI